MQRITAIFHGRVQGVGFRAMARMKAQELGLKGYIENLPDGTVKLVSEGEKETLEKLVAHMKERVLFGSKIVDRVDVSYEEATGEFKEFSIRR